MQENFVLKDVGGIFDRSGKLVGFYDHADGLVMVSGVKQVFAAKDVAEALDVFVEVYKREIKKQVS